MPINHEGVRAEVIGDGDSTIKRMNVGRPYEQYVNATTHMVSNNVRRMMDAKDFEAAWSYLKDYYTTASPLMGELVDETLTNEDAIEAHLNSVYRDGAYLYLPPHSPTIGHQQIIDLKERFPIDIRPVTYISSNGDQVTTKDPILIATTYMILLEKTGDDWAAVSSIRRQHHGVPAKLTNVDKYSMPWREQPLRFIGEAEGRLLGGVMGGEFLSEAIEMSNSPELSKKIARNILTSQTPSRIDEVYDRLTARRGSSRSLEFVNHIHQCSGVHFVRNVKNK